MAGLHILPLGFIDKTTDDGTIILLTTPTDSHNLSPKMTVTLSRRGAGIPPSTKKRDHQHKLGTKLFSAEASHQFI